MAVQPCFVLVAYYLCMDIFACVNCFWAPVFWNT